jgi:hypothetical protein
VVKKANHHSPFLFMERPMRAYGWLAGVVLAFGGAALFAGPGDGPPASQARIQSLIDRLGSALFREREAAGRELDALGEVALDALRKAAGAGDPETRRRAAELVERIDARLTTTRLLTPTLVQLDYKDTPLAAAVADLAKRTGAPITLASTDAYTGRTVTVASGPLPFWEALELFSRQAGVHEREDPFYREESYKTVIIGQANPNGGNVVQRRAIFVDALTTDGNPTPGVRPFTLIDGPDTAGPADLTRSVRVRVSSTGVPSRVPNRGDDSIIPLHVSAEPRLLCPGACDVRITRAVDDLGQSLTASAVRPAADADGEELIFMANGALMPRWSPARPGPIALRLKRGEKPAKSLRELTGTVTTQLYLSEVVATVDRPAAAVGTTVAGERDVTLKLIDWSRHMGGEVRVTVEVQMPQVGLSAVALQGQLQLAMLARLQPLGGVANRQGSSKAAPPFSPASGTDYEGLSLEDRHGRRLPVVGGSRELKSAPHGYSIQILASFRAENDAEPARLVLTLPRPVLIDVPFTLKDVPLP